MKGHCSWSLKPSFYPEIVKAQIPVFAAVNHHTNFPTAGNFVWGSSFCETVVAFRSHLGPFSLHPSPFWHSFSVRNKLFLGNYLLTASFLPAGTSEPWKSVVQKRYKAGSKATTPPWWIHTKVTWHLISGWMQLLVLFWNCLWRISRMDTHGQHTLQNMS